MGAEAYDHHRPLNDAHGEFVWVQGAELIRYLIGRLKLVFVPADPGWKLQDESMGRIYLHSQGSDRIGLFAVEGGCYRDFVGLAESMGFVKLSDDTYCRPESEGHQQPELEGDGRPLDVIAYDLYEQDMERRGRPEEDASNFI